MLTHPQRITLDNAVMESVQKAGVWPVYAPPSGNTGYARLEIAVSNLATFSAALQADFSKSNRSELSR